jgi:hypothetical protein
MSATFLDDAHPAVRRGYHCPLKPARRSRTRTFARFFVRARSILPPHCRLKIGVGLSSPGHPIESACASLVRLAGRISPVRGRDVEVAIYVQAWDLIIKVRSLDLRVERHFAIVMRITLSPSGVSS